MGKIDGFPYGLPALFILRGSTDEDPVKLGCSANLPLSPRPQERLSGLYGLLRDRQEPASSAGNRRMGTIHPGLSPLMAA